jgi:hypothetical protein
MSDEVADLLARNEAWAAQVEENDPGFFERLAAEAAFSLDWLLRQPRTGKSDYRPDAW